MSFFFGLILGNIMASNSFYILKSKYIFLDHYTDGTRVTDYDGLNVVTKKYKIDNWPVFSVLRYDDGWQWYVRHLELRHSYYSSQI